MQLLGQHSLPLTSQPLTPIPWPVVPSFDAEAYFRGKKINLMTNGSSDVQARYMAREWSKFIPGNPRVAVRTITPVVEERNFVWNAKPDGLTLAIEATPGVVEMFTPQAQFDVRESTMIGVTSGGEGAWFVRGTLLYGCIDSAFDSPGPILTVGWNAPTVPAPAHLGSMKAIGWLVDKMNIPFEIRKDSSEQYLMLERGEVNSWTSYTAWDQLTIERPGWIANGFLRSFADLSFPSFDLGHNGEADFHCPNVADEYLKGDDLDLWGAIHGPHIYASRNIIGPPNMPSEVTDTLRDALATAMVDKEFTSSMQQFTGINVLFTDAMAAQQVITHMANAFEANKGKIDEIAQAVFDKYVR